MKKLSLLAALALCTTLSWGQKKKTETKEEPSKLHQPGTYGALKFRNVGPSITAGRVADIAVNPLNTSEYYLAVASGGIWKTTNNGITYYPIFDSYGSYSIGCLTIDPSNPNVIWAGTGENNGQRSIAYGDGIYKSVNGGKSWTNMGLKTSEHIGRIIVHPENSDIVYVAAHGPLWSEGGERGVYKTEDGGKTWTCILEIDEHTGVNDIIMDPRNPDVIYASAWQRRRHVFTYMSGGPGSGLHKTMDGGKTWTAINSGLPGSNRGRIGLAISPADPEYLYAIVEAGEGMGGFYRSLNRGASWEKRSSYSTSGNYYQEIICDPHDKDKIFAMDTYCHYSVDGGKTFKNLPEKHKHVDNHALWIDPSDTDHLIMGCDGGVYESWDMAQSWHFKPNLPITQFYRVAVDNASPFYNIYGGTQDNYSLGGPSRTTKESGINNSDWIVTQGGDGFESQVDPTDENIIYAQAQYGWLVRFDKKSGERMAIQPQPKKGEPALRWNWDAPLLISPHNHKRIYFAANILFKSDDRGDTWEAISPDLTRQLDRNTFKVMGKTWSMDAVAKHRSTTIYGNIVAFDESRLQENLLYVGTDDGLIQITEDGGKNWNKIEQVTGVPSKTYVNCLKASKHDANVVYAAFNNHKNGDFKPYMYKSSDKGKTWTSITANLPERGSVFCIEQDHVNPKLLFVGTEFGVFFTLDEGQNWTQMKAGLPTIAIRDLTIQERENDLVLASFGRGFYVLDNYAPLREVSEEVLAKDMHIFPIKDAWMFVASTPMGFGEKGFLGASLYGAKNPEIGSVFTYYVKEGTKTKKQLRKEAEKDQDNPTTPSFEAIRAEDNELSPYLLFTIKDQQGNVIRRIKTDAGAGMKRLVWNFRYPSTYPTSGGSGMNNAGDAHMVLPGTYTVEVDKSVNGVLTHVHDAVSFKVKALNNTTLPAADRAALVAFQNEMSELNSAIVGTQRFLRDLQDRTNKIKVTIENSPEMPIEQLADIVEVRNELIELDINLNGDKSLKKREYPVAPSISERMSNAIWANWSSTSAPTQTQKEQYAIAKELFTELHTSLKELNTEVEKIEQAMNEQGAPWTPGRLPEWNKD